MELSAIKAEFKEKQPTYYAALEKLEVLDQYLTNVKLYYCAGSALTDEFLPIMFIEEWDLANGFAFQHTAEGEEFWWNILDKCVSILFPNVKSILDYYAEITQNNGFSRELCADWCSRFCDRYNESLPRMLQAVDKYSEKHPQNTQGIGEFLDILYFNTILAAS